MDETFSYPFDAMDTTANNIHKEIANALPIHHQIINTMTNLEGLFPGSVETTFTSHIKSWAQNMEACYASLDQLAEHLSQGSHLMATTDHNISQEFTPQ